MTKRKLPRSITKNEKKDFNTKRKLIKGSMAAVPVVMTLKSGAAMALSSTQCFDHSQSQAQALNQSSELPKFRDSLQPNIELFLRAEVAWAKLNRIKRDSTLTYWILDKKANGDIRMARIYNHDSMQIPLQGSGLNTASTQKTFSDTGDSIDVYDSDLTVPGGSNQAAPVFSATTRFNNGNHDFVIEKSRVKFGLVMVDNNGQPIMDGLGGNRIGKIVDSGTLQSEHITGSCWTSLTPTP